MTDSRGPNWRRTQNGHRCNFPGCDEIVAGRLWGCREHWAMVPVDLRDAWMAAGLEKGYSKGTRLPNRPAVKFVDSEIKNWFVQNVY